MLVIFFKDSNTGSVLPPIEWHVGEPSPKIPKDLIASRISHVQVDGHELLHVQKTFRGLPETNRPVITYFDGDAKFVAAHLK